jgi:hypothetical protein
MGNLTATPYITKMFEYIALDVQSKSGIQVHYEHGHPVEIDNILEAWSKTPDNSKVKYPMIALFQDYDEQVTDRADLMCEVKLELIIATMTLPQYTAPQRMVNTFVPILYPLYYQFIQSVIKSGYFAGVAYGKPDHTKTDRMFWGKNKEAVFCDYVDAVHIQNLSLKVKQFNCK